MLLFGLVSAAWGNTWVLGCATNPGDGNSCPSYSYTLNGVVPAAGTFIMVADGATFQGWETVRYLTVPPLVGGPVTALFCVDDGSAQCAGDVKFWSVGSLGASGRIYLLDNGAPPYVGQFALIATQDVVFAVGLALCGLLGVMTGIRLT